MARPTKLDTDLQEKIVTRLSAGATIQATCDSVGIKKQTFYNWMKRGEKEKEGEFFDFFDASTRAIADGLITATIRFREGMNPSQQEAVTTETQTETRLRKVKTSDGKIVEEPYEYKKTVTRKTVTHVPGDWRAAMEYLARRDPENWARQAPQKHDVTVDGEIKTDVTHKFDPSSMSDDDLRRIASSLTSES